MDPVNFIKISPGTQRRPEMKGMSMKCPNCGNELSADEVFCGQCGTPNMPAPKPTRMVNPPLSRQQPPSGGYNTVMPPLSGTYRSGMQPLPGNQPAVRQPGPQQQPGFYHDATEAITSLPNNEQNYAPIYPQQGFTGVPMSGRSAEAGPFGPPIQAQPYQKGNYTGTVYPPAQIFYTGQGYGIPPEFTPPPQKNRSSVVLLIMSVCLALAIITVAAFGAVFLIRNNASGQTHTPTNQNASPTSITTPTLVPSPTLSPSPAPTMTPTPDAGFAWCDMTCTSNGFSVEYPGTWLQKSTSDSLGTQFTNPSQSDEFAAFKTPGVATMNADQLVSSDLNNYSPQPSYTTPTPTSSSASNTTIGGETWVYQTANYQLNGQTERIQVYATVHQGKAYIIELQAPDTQFDATNTQYFQSIFGRFQFL
jgi:hypothetical protein